MHTDTRCIRLSVTLALLALAGCRGCRRGGGVAGTSGAPGPAAGAGPAAVVDAGPPPPYQRVVLQGPPLPRQINLQQIFIGFDKGTAPWMSAKAKKRTVAQARAEAEHLVAEARHGADFQALAKHESEWPLANINGAAFGVLAQGGSGLLSAFDEQIFKLKVNEVSDPLESAIGFHVVKRVPGVHVAHILIAVHDGVSGPPARTKAEALALADKISEELKAGSDFATEAYERSDDLASAGRGGDLGVLDPRVSGRNPIYGIGEKLPVGAVSAPTEVPLGYDLVKRLE